MSILTVNDFKTGEYYIPTKGVNQVADFEEYIDKYELTYLSKLFGKELYELFIADLAGGSTPTTPRFIFIFDPFLDQEHHCLYESKGIKEMLKGLLYFHYLRDRVSTVTTDGIQLTSSENAETMNGISHSLISRYNQGIETFKVIQHFMCDNPDIYPEFKGVYQHFAHGF